MGQPLSADELAQLRLDRHRARRARVRGALRETELWSGTVHRGELALSYRVVRAGCEIRLHLAVPVRLPPGATVRPPRFAERLFDRIFADLAPRAAEFLGEFLRPGSGGRS